MNSKEVARVLDKVKLKDDSGVSRAYKIALANPTIATVASLQDAWIRFVENAIDRLEAEERGVEKAK